MLIDYFKLAAFLLRGCITFGTELNYYIADLGSFVICNCDCTNCIVFINCIKRWEYTVVAFCFGIYVTRYFLCIKCNLNRNACSNSCGTRISKLSCVLAVEPRCIQAYRNLCINLKAYICVCTIPWSIMFFTVCKASISTKCNSSVELKT